MVNDSVSFIDGKYMALDGRSDSLQKATPAVRGAFAPGSFASQSRSMTHEGSALQVNSTESRPEIGKMASVPGQNMESDGYTLGVPGDSFLPNEKKSETEYWESLECQSCVYKARNPSDAKSVSLPGIIQERMLIVSY